MLLTERFLAGPSGLLAQLRHHGRHFLDACGLAAGDARQRLARAHERRGLARALVWPCRPPLALPHLILFLRWYGVERMGVDSQFVRLSVVFSQGRSRIVPLLC